MATVRSEVVLVVGGTGDLGGRVVRELLARGKRVRALVREGSDASRLAAQGVEVVRGDMLDPASLDRPMAGTDAVVTSAIGYSRRKSGDSLRTDFDGNRNLIDAAKKAGVRRFVLTSILTCDQAPDVPHFWAKKLAEDRLEELGVPYVALRPGAYLGGGGAARFMARGLRQGKVTGFTPPAVRITYIHPDEVARALALAVDEPRALNRKIDLGSDRPLSSEELAGILTDQLGRPIRVGGRGMFRVFGFLALFVPSLRDMAKMSAFFATGKYVAETTVQAELFGPVPKVEDAVRKMLQELDLGSPHATSTT